MTAAVKRSAALRALGWVAAFALAAGGPAAALPAGPTAAPHGTAAAPERSSNAGSSPPLASAVAGVELVVSDLERSKAFFEQLGFESGVERELSGAALGARAPRGARVRRLELSLGSERMALLDYLSPSDGRAVPADSRGNDRWFQHVAIVVRDMDRAYAWLRARRVAHVSTGPQTLPSWNRAAGGIRAFYFADPDGHTLEIIHFPKGKGDPRWQAPVPCQREPVERCLFLGIDHTAITVEDTDQSLAFYRDRLGLRVAGESENYGVEQEHLNAVFGARLRITALRAAAGPGIELLEYLAPRGGRPMPANARQHDLYHWQILVRVSDPEAVAAAAADSGGRAISQSREQREALVRDRDGHALLASGQSELTP